MKNFDESQIEIANTIKLLIFKENPKIYEFIDIDDDDIFLNPLLFCYFNTKNDSLKNNINISEMLQGFMQNIVNYKLKNFFNSENIAYIPNIGYFNKQELKPFENSIYVKDSKIEVIKYPSFLLEKILNQNGLFLNNNIEISTSLFDLNIDYLNNAINFIKTFSKDHYKFIEKSCKMVLIFKANPNDSNSFATINAHGIAFLNVYQDNYDEVFFVDDIAHQTGHIILTTFLYKKNIFNIDKNKQVEEVIKKPDHRTIETLFHALYTYYTTFTCLDDCLSGNVFSDTQRKEAIARIGFYIYKSNADIDIFEFIIENFVNSSNLLEKDGQIIYSTIKEKFSFIKQKWAKVIINFDYSNQTYNFDFKKFKLKND